MEENAQKNWIKIKLNSDYNPTVSDRIKVFNQNIADMIIEEGKKLIKEMDEYCVECGLKKVSKNSEMLCDDNISDEITVNRVKTLQDLIDKGFVFKPKIQPTSLNFNRDVVPSFIYTLFKYPTFNLNATEEVKKIMKKLKRVMFHHDIKEIYNEFDAKNKSCKIYGGSRNNGKNAMAVEILRLRNKIKKLENDIKS